MSEITTQCIFCDDVRQEIGGKLSFMGVYDDKMLVPSFPSIVTSLNVVVKIQIPIDQIDYDGQLTIDVFGVERSLTIKPSTSIVGPPPPNAAGAKVIVHMECKQLQLDKEGSITVYLEKSGERALVDRLRVSVGSPN